jgi:hypothetical protein
MSELDALIPRTNDARSFLAFGLRCPVTVGPVTVLFHFSLRVCFSAGSTFYRKNQS